jgi:hypothetical protein
MPRGRGLSIVVLDGYARSWFIVNPSALFTIAVMVDKQGKQYAEEKQQDRKLWTLREFPYLAAGRSPQAAC